MIKCEKSQAGSRVFFEQLSVTQFVRCAGLARRGSYHPESCKSYTRTKNADRWFCSEEEAKAGGYRKSYAC
jgi:hypothetical protein